MTHNALDGQLMLLFIYTLLQLCDRRAYIVSIGLKLPKLA